MSSIPGMLLSESPRPGPVHWRILLFSFAGWLSVFTALMLFMALAPLYAGELGLDDGQVGWIKSLALGATGLGGLAFGIFGDRFGRRPAMGLSVGLAAAGLVGAAIASGAWALGAAALLAGFGIGGQWASGQTLVGETVPPRLRARFGTLSQSGAPLGLIGSTLLSTALAPAVGWRCTFGLAALVGLLLPATWLLVPESDLWLARRAAASRDPSASAARKPGLPDLLAPDLRRIFGIAFALTLLCMANYWFTVTWLREFMARSWGLGLARSGDWFLVFAAGSLVGYSLYGLTASRVGRRPAFTLFCALMAVGTAMLTVFEGTLRGEPRLVLAFAAVAGVGTGLWSEFGPLYTELFPTRVRTTAGGICMNVSRGVQFLAPHLVTLVGGPRLGAGVGLAALFALLAGGLVWALPETRGRALS